MLSGLALRGFFWRDNDWTSDAPAREQTFTVLSGDVICRVYSEIAQAEPRTHDRHCISIPLPTTHASSTTKRASPIPSFGVDEFQESKRRVDQSKIPNHHFVIPSVCLPGFLSSERLPAIVSDCLINHYSGLRKHQVLMISTTTLFIDVGYGSRKQHQYLR